MRGRCPICDKPRSERYKPFCSRRCADIDLGRWLKGQYAIPSAPGLEEEEDAPAFGEREHRPPGNDAKR
jgi:endogenous inhibitor of DNA gyrase (YacG/DUF329 family)